jgi:hypothetical protein
MHNDTRSLNKGHAIVIIEYLREEGVRGRATSFNAFVLMATRKMYGNTGARRNRHKGSEQVACMIDRHYRRRFGIASRSDQRIAPSFNTRFAPAAVMATKLQEWTFNAIAVRVAPRPAETGQNLSRQIRR